jgi:hypothetical protein
VNEGAGTLPAWATWAEPHELGPYTVGIEEDLPGRDASFTAETHGSALEIQTSVHASIGGAIEELIFLARS